CRKKVKELSRDAVSETGLGRYEDKVLKNMLVIEKTPGTEYLETRAMSGDNGLTLIEYAPYGVIGSITPCTNPSETIINNGIGMIAAGNAVVFNAHPLAKNISAKTVRLMNEASISVGGPSGIAACLASPTIQTASELMKHPGIRLLVVTGGPAVVKAAMNSGKKVIAAGPGNPPAVVDETADIEKAGVDIVNGCSFDNNIVCIVEKEVIAVRSVVERLKDVMKRNGAYEVSGRHLAMLEKILVVDGHPGKDFVGKNASYILKHIGISVPDSVRV
ncbi:unnamed protein product, partial [marine sediment metagenome]